MNTLIYTKTGNSKSFLFNLLFKDSTMHSVLLFICFVQQINLTYETGISKRASKYFLFFCKTSTELLYLTSWKHVWECIVMSIVLRNLKSSVFKNGKTYCKYIINAFIHNKHVLLRVSLLKKKKIFNNQNVSHILPTSFDPSNVV